MRIITGKYKGRIIKMPKGIRPTQDKIRKALFDILGDIEGLSFLELFAGSGAVGIEALSQGANEVVFVEKDKRCIEAIQANLGVIGVSDGSIIGLDTTEVISRISQKKKKFDIIFLDPPYYKALAPRLRPSLRSGLEDDSEQSEESRSGSTTTAIGESLTKKTLQMLEACDILAPNGFIVVQHFKRDELPKEAGQLKIIKEARYGDTVLSFYRKKVT